MLSALREKKEGIVLQKSDAQRRIARLKVSESPRVIATREVKKSYPTSGWWVLCLFGGGWGWGKQSARETLDYRAAWFSRYEIKGGDYKGEIRIEEPAKGVLNVDFTSTPGVNLDVTVSFYRPEKDTEETAQQVASLERQVDSLAAQLEECETKICSFTCADSPTNLAALIMTEKDALEQADRDLVEMLDRPATQPTDDFPKPPSQWSVITNFRGVLSVLVENKMLPLDLAPSTRRLRAGLGSSAEASARAGERSRKQHHHLTEERPLESPVGRCPAGEAQLSGHGSCFHGDLLHSIGRR